MMDWLMNLLGYGQPKIDSEAQLRQLQGRSFSSRAEDDARRAGFQSAAQMTDYLRQKNTPTGGTVPKGKGGKVDMRALNPYYSLHVANDAYRKANEGS